ncbi:succinate dehydrogenase cytochrome b subunit [Amycolatopsis anabasis]|uniref:succinate dehydrogenase cytochrome b subunit n=1 Tax=Amycolatopsis anabasis TaxID=1840409 RepID=UPI001FE3C9F2|nr:succinate dehydrogenase cytochrome b subunit [Amycolatopsis anabasis]
MTVLDGRPVDKAPRRRGKLRRLWSSTIGKKAVMGVTGAVLLLYVTVHMLSNLKAFISPANLDGYAVWLRRLLDGLLGYEGFVWVVRIVLSLSVLLHMVAAFQLARRARAARPAGYQHRPKIQGGYAARTLRWGGVIIALFLVYHLLDLTTGDVNPHGVHGAVYANVVASFSRWYVTLFYALAVIALGFHLRHGLWSGLQSLGASTAARQRIIQRIALGYSLFLTIGFLSVPVAVLTGILR